MTRKKSNGCPIALRKTDGPPAARADRMENKRSTETIKSNANKQQQAERHRTKRQSMQQNKHRYDKSNNYPTRIEANQFHHTQPVFRVKKIKINPKEQRSPNPNYHVKGLVQKTIIKRLIQCLTKYNEQSRRRHQKRIKTNQKVTNYTQKPDKSGSMVRRGPYVE